jgi:hypothetical protein
MKSNKQRRQKIRVRRLQRVGRKACRVNTSSVDHLIDTMTVTLALLLRNHSDSILNFAQHSYYQNRPFRCENCGVEELWTAAKQQQWYKVAQGETWTTAIRYRVLSST